MVSDKIFSNQERKNVKSTLTTEDITQKRKLTQNKLRKRRRFEKLSKKRKEAHVDDPNLLRKINSLPMIKNGLLSNDDKVKFENTVQLRQMLSIEQGAPIQEVIDLGIIPILIGFLQRKDNTILQFEACWALTNIATGESEHIEVLIASGMVPILIDTMGSSQPFLVEQCIWALGNIIGDSYRARNYVLKEGILHPLLRVISEQSTMQVLRCATWALSNLCRTKPQPEFVHLKPAVETLCELIYSEDHEILADVLWALNYISDGEDDRVDEIMHYKIDRRLVELLYNPMRDLQVPALRTIGNILTAAPGHVTKMIEAQVLSGFRYLLERETTSIVKETCWAVSNVCAGTSHHIEQVLQSGIVPILINIMYSEEPHVRREACWCICNALANGKEGHIEAIVKLGCITPLVNMLTVKESIITAIVISAIESILRLGRTFFSSQGSINQWAKQVESIGGLRYLFDLQSHSNAVIAKRSSHIMKTYFPDALDLDSDDDDEDDEYDHVQHHDFNNNTKVAPVHYNFNNNGPPMQQPPPHQGGPPPQQQPPQGGPHQMHPPHHHQQGGPHPPHQGGPPGGQW